MKNKYITGGKNPKFDPQHLIYMLPLCSSKARDRYRPGTCRPLWVLGARFITTGVL